MWLFKFKSMRPPEKWGSKAAKGKGPARKRPSRSKSATAVGEPQSEANDAGSPADDEAGTPIDTSLPHLDYDPFRVSVPRSDYDAQHGSAPRERPSNSDGDRPQSITKNPTLDDEAALAALQKAIEASPPKFPGSRATPIDLDGDARGPSVRRLLFPSPRKNGEMKSLTGLHDDQDGHSPMGSSQAKTATVIVDSDEKENNNCVQGVDSHDPFKTPLRRSPRKARSQRNTPTKVKSPEANDVTPFTAQMTQILSSDALQSPTMFSDPAFNIFNDSAFVNATNDFTFSTDFNNDGYATDMPLPQSDADYFPVFDDVDLNGDAWNGGPLLDGELEALLKEAGDSGCETYFAANGVLDDAAAVQTQGATEQPPDDAQEAPWMP